MSANAGDVTTSAVAKKPREPTPASFLKKVAGLSDTTKILTKEVKQMTKIFGDNQKILISLKSMIDSLTMAMEHIQSQSRRMEVIEEDAQKLFAGLNQVRAQSGAVARLGDQALRMQEQIRRIEEDRRTPAETAKLSHKVSESMESIRNNSKMIISIAQRLDEVKDGLRDVSSKTEIASGAAAEIEGLKKEMQRLAEKAVVMEDRSADVSYVKAKLEELGGRLLALPDLAPEISGIQRRMNLFSSAAERIDSIGRSLDLLGDQVMDASARSKDLEEVPARLTSIESELSSIAQRADSAYGVGESLKSVEGDLAELKDGVYEKTESIERQVSSLEDAVRRYEVSSTESIESIGAMEIKGDLKVLAERISGAEEDRKDLEKRLAEIPNLSGVPQQIKALSSAARRIDSIGSSLDLLRDQFRDASTRSKDLAEVPARLTSIESELSSLARRTDSAAGVGEELKSVEGDLAELKDGVFEKTDEIGSRVSTLADAVRRSEALAAEFHAKAEVLFRELEGVRSAAGRTSDDSSLEMMALLKLSAYQSKMRMNAESKYGTADDLKNMASHTTEIINLFDRVSVEARGSSPLPRDMRRWALSKILECADSWEIRFPDALDAMIAELGAGLMKESISMEQVREIYGTRAEGELRERLGLS